MARKILLADDSVTAQNMGRKILADAGYEVFTVNNGSAALKKISEIKPDLIVLDVYMPGYSGLEVCQRLKETQETSRYPVLLTVGKLEPFKPEEAKRVRADGFIVKPFEASELLSALSKLEDKIVPRQESSKPGRFARVTAAIEDKSFDKTVAIEEDTGWKNRIAFPSKKKEKAAQSDVDDQEAYNFAKKEASFADHKLAEKHREQKIEEHTVDLGALAPEGLPKDVTPEEIAALAAAAAQMKGTVAESQAEPSQEPQPQTPETASLAATAEIPAATFVPRESDEKIEAKAPETTEEKVEAVELKSSEFVAPASEAEVVPVSVASDTRSEASPDSSAPQTTSDQTANEPVTMAMAAAAASSAYTPRWTAVPVALNQEESAISLEDEMRKTYAAIASADTGTTVADVVEPQLQESSAQATISAPTETEAQSAAAIPTMSVPEAAQTLSALVRPSTEVIRAAVQDLETEAEQFVPEPGPAVEVSPAQPIETEPVKNTAEAPQTIESTAAAAHEQPISKTESLETALPEISSETSKALEAFSNDQASVSSNEITGNAMPEATTGFESAAVQESTPESPVAELTSDLTVSSSKPVPEAAAEVSKADSEATDSTAAAWASWNQARSEVSTTSSDNSTSKSFEQQSPQESAAMAVAAGAEKAPEEAAAESESDPAAIASIVDSVLADLRPKIFEEISRKMGKKK